MLVSVSSWSYRKLFDEKKMDILAFVDEAKRLGADGLEVFPSYLSQEDIGGHLKQVARKAETLGLSIASLIVGNDFARPTAVERAEQVERTKQWIAYAAEAGVHRLNTFTGYHTPGADPFMEACRVVDAYREVMPVADKHDAVLCIENHSTVCTDADGILSIIAAVGSSRLRTNPDFTNFVPEFRARSKRSLEAIYRETEKIARLAANAHLKVGEFTETGDDPYVDVPRLLDILRKAGYDGHIVLEYYGADDPAAACAKGVALLRRLL
jgi:sugar phosphate isomerase/epimerase